MAFMSEMTFGQAKSRVATALGGQGDANILTIAGYALQASMSYISGKKDWNWSLTPATDIAVLGGTQDYALPVDFKKVYDARFSGERELGWCDLREYNRADWNQASGMARWYSVLSYGTPRLDYIRLLPVPSTAHTLKLVYFRNILMPTADATTLDVPGVYENMVIWLGKAYLLADRDAENARTAFWLGRGEEELKGFKADDDYQPDRETRFISAAEHGHHGFDPTHPSYYLDD